MELSSPAILPEEVQEACHAPFSDPISKLMPKTS
jgi:hypothetical protein